MQGANLLPRLEEVRLCGFGVVGEIVHRIGDAIIVRLGGL
jgi:hypothetical protein